jgi:LysM repeat protein
VERGWRRYGKRFAAPAAFLLAVTVAVLLVRAGLQTTPASDTTSIRTQTVTHVQVTTAAVAPRHRRYYRLKTGETLSDVAIKFRTSVEQLLALNPGVQPTNLVVGERIRVK